MLGDAVLPGSGVIATIVISASGEVGDTTPVAMVGVLTTEVAVSCIRSVLLEQEAINIEKNNEAAIIS